MRNIFQRNKNKKKNAEDDPTDPLAFCWTLGPEEVTEALGLPSSALTEGLSTEEVEERTAKFGPNALKDKGGTKLWRIIFHHLVNIMSFVLFVAFVLAMVTQQWVDAGVVMGIIILNAIIGVSQEYKSEKTMEALKRMSSPSSFVIRANQPAVKVLSSQLVPGDVVVISTGDKIPADMRLISVNDLECDESLLTGESALVEKKIEPIAGQEMPLGDRKNMVYMGSEVKMGKGMGIVVRTAQSTELGKIADSVGSAKKQTTGLEKRMNWMGLILAVVAAVAVGLVLLGLWVHDTEDLYPEGLQVGVTTAVALIPEALVPVITLGLTLGVRRMAKKKALVRKLAALEQLGNITDICSDKTGTLTQNKMVATDMWLASEVRLSVTGEGFDPTFGEFLIQDGEFDDDQESSSSEEDEEEEEEEELEEEEEEEEEEEAGEAQSVSTCHVVDKEAIDKPENGDLKMALLVSCLCSASDIYKKRLDPHKEKKPGWWQKILCCLKKKEKEEDVGEKEMETFDQDLENAIETADMENQELGLTTAEGDSLLPDDGQDDYTWTFKGTATEAALVVLARKAGYNKHTLTRPTILTAEEAAAEERGEGVSQSSSSDEEGATGDNVEGEKAIERPPKWIEKVEYSFDSVVKLMSVVTMETSTGRHMVFSKGAPERLLPKCISYLKKKGEVDDLDEDFLERIKQVNDKMAYKGLRVLALAFREYGGPDAWPPAEGGEEGGEGQPAREDIEKDLIFVGLVGIKDPPRPGVKEAIAVCHQAGITVRMVTGDHPSTSAAIARQIGLIPNTGSTDGLVMTSTDFDRMTDEELAQLEEIPVVIARCSPESKVKMVELLHRNKKVTAMTGDGVNDSPAITIADVGIAMGQAGTEVTKEAADIILVDDDFSTIVDAISEGRRIFANIRKFIVHLLAGNVAEAIVMVVGILAGLRPPIGPLQILWVNLVTGTPPAICLSVERASNDLMDKKKRPIGERLFTALTIVDIFYYGLVMGGLALGAYIAMETYFADHKEAQATCYITLTALLLVHAYNCRRLKKASIFSKSFFTRAWGFHLSFLFGLGSAVFTLYTPGLNDTVFHQTSVGYWGWVLCAGATLAFLFASEGYKMARKTVRRMLVKNRLRREAVKARRIKAKKRRRAAAKTTDQPAIHTNGE